VILLVLVLMVGCTLGLIIVITLVGHFATVSTRLHHQREMVKLGEQQKLNALTIRERDITLAERGMRVLGEYTPTDRV